MARRTPTHKGGWLQQGLNEAAGTSIRKVLKEKERSSEMKQRPHYGIASMKWQLVLESICGYLYALAPITARWR